MRLTSQADQAGPKYRVLLLALFSLALVWPVLLAPAAYAQDLSPQDQQKLAAIQSGLERVQTNLELAQQSAGAGTPTASKAKLSKMRLGSAAVDVPQLKQLLAELPAADPQVAQAASALAQTEQAIANIQVVKLVNNLILGVTVCALAEGLVLGVKAGVEPARLVGGVFEEPLAAPADPFALPLGFLPNASPAISATPARELITEEASSGIMRTFWFGDFAMPSSAFM